MKIYVGETVKKAVNSKDQPVSKTHIAKQIGLSRTQFYTILQDQEMDPAYVIKIGKVIGKDFRKEIAQLREFPEEQFFVKEEVIEHGMTFEELKSEMIDLQRKYIHALEDIRQLQKEVRDLEKRGKIPT